MQDNVLSEIIFLHHTAHCFKNEAHTIFEYLQRGKRSEIVFLFFENSRRWVKHSKLDTSTESSSGLDLFAQRHAGSFLIRFVARVAHEMSHSLFIIHKIACRMLAARKQNQLDRTVRRANEHEIYRICVCVFVPLPK